MQQSLIYYKVILIKLLFYLARLLASKNLPAAIEDTSGNELPESIREKAEGLQGQGGVAALESKIYSLPELLQRNKEIIDEVGGAYPKASGI